MTSYEKGLLRNALLTPLDIYPVRVFDVYRYAILDVRYALDVFAKANIVE